MVREGANEPQEKKHSNASASFVEKERVTAMFSDVVERQYTAEALKKSKPWHDAVFASMNEAVLIFDSAGNISGFNDAFLRYYRFKSRSEVPTNVKGFSDIINAYRLMGKN